MPSYPNIPAGYGLVRHHIITPGGNGHAFNIYGVKLHGTPTAAAVVAAVHSTFGTNVMGHITSDNQLTDTLVTVNNGGVLSQSTDTTPVSGASTPPSVPGQVCLLVQKETGVIGKHFHGRMYTPGVADVHLDTTRDNWLAAFVSSAQTDYNNFLADLQAGVVTDNMVLLHRDLAVPPTVVSFLNVESKLATQRRRLRKAAHR